MSPRLALIISSLALGGAERVLSQLARYWHEQGAEVTVITLAGTEEDFFTLPAGVEQVALDLMQTSYGPIQALVNNLGRAHALRRALSKARPQAVVSFMDATNVLALLASTGKPWPVVISERTDLAGHGANLAPAWRRLRRMMYPRAAAAVAATPSVAAQMASAGPGLKPLVIPNPVDPAGAGEEPEVAWDGPAVAGLGRLVEMKGFDLLIRAFASAAPEGEWKLVVMGDGPEKEKLQALSDELGLGERLILPGAVRRPLASLARAEAFALCSRYEGFPNALVEAMACGLAVVTSDFGGWAGEVLEPGREGLVVPVGDQDALAEALARLMEDAELRQGLGAAAAQRAREYSPRAVMAAWNELLNQVTGGRWACG